MRKPKPTSIAEPKTLAAEIDEAFIQREAYRDAQRVADEFKTRFSEAEAALLGRIRKEGLEKAAGSMGTVSVSESEEPVVEPEGWPKVWAWIHKNKAYELLQKRISSSAWRERRDAGIAIPGTTTFLNVRLNMRSKT